MSEEVNVIIFRGDVFGPNEAVDTNLVSFSGTTGKAVQDSGVRVSDLATSAQGAKADTAIQVADYRFPQGTSGVLTTEHGETVYNVVMHVAKSGSDLNDGLSPFRPKLTIKAAIEALSTISGTKRMGTVYVGPGRFIEEPLGVTTTALGQGFRLIGSGTNPVTGTEIVMHSGAEATDNMLTFHATEDVHHAVIEGAVIDMRGYGRDGLYMGAGGFNTVLRDLSFKNIPRWGCYHFSRPVTLQVDNVTGGYCGFGQGTSSQSVTFADEGGGAFHMVQPSLPQWAAGQTVRLTTSGTLPTGFAHHTNYWLVDDGGLLRLSATEGGDPIVATDAGTGNHRLYGGDRFPDIGQVTFTDVGGGNYHLSNPLPRDWIAGDLVRVRATGLIPTLLAGGTTYELIDDDGALHLSEVGSGVPLAASSAGTGIIWLEDDYDPEEEGGFFYLKNTGSSSLSTVSFDAIQLDGCGRYPFFIEEQGSSTAVSVTSIRSIETEVPFYQSAHCHDALVGVRGSPNDAKTALVIESAQCHVAGGGVNMLKSIVKQLDAGPLTICLSAQNVYGAGSQYDHLLAVADQTLLVDFELAPLFAAGGPIIHHGDIATDTAFKASYGARATGGWAHPCILIQADGTIKWGTGAAAPTTRISIDPATGHLVLTGFPTSDPGVAGAPWINGTALHISAG